MKMTRTKSKLDFYDDLDEIKMEVEFGAWIVVHVMTTHQIIVHIYLNQISDADKLRNNLWRLMWGPLLHHELIQFVDTVEGIMQLFDVQPILKGIIQMDLWLMDVDYKFERSQFQLVTMLPNGTGTSWLEA